ncbi:MAG: tripartite tricarboxylate transporter TctB family protein [Pseudonocardia sp.]
MTAPGTTPERAWVEVPFPLALVGLGVFTVLDAGTITVPGSTNVVGPRAFPYAIGALLVVTGVAVLVAVARGRRGEAEVGEDVDTHVGTDWVRVVLLAASLLALIVMIEPLGWPIAATVLFGGAAWSLGARPLWRPLAVGAVVAVVTQIVFTQALGVYLPAGPLEGVALFG